MLTDAAAALLAEASSSPASASPSTAAQGLLDEALLGGATTTSSHKVVTAGPSGATSSTAQMLLEEAAAAAAPAQPKKKKPGLSVVTTPAPPAGPKRVMVSDTGSLRGDGISVSMAGLRVAGNAAVENLKLSEFDICHKLGEGTSGSVVLVAHKPTARPFAMKVIRLSCSEQERRQILVELRTLHEAHAPGIIDFHGAFYEEGTVNIVLEWMDCGSLADAARHGPLAEPMLRKVARDCAAGLAFLHRELKVVHRDIKPGNVLLNSARQAKLADFGMSGQLASTLARLASWVGTAAYMAPERIAGADYSFDSDVWSLGVTLWECAMGAFPYGEAVAGADALPEEEKGGFCFWELLHHIKEGEAPPLPPDRFPAPMVDLVGSCMAKDAARRPSAPAILAHEWIDGADDLDLREWWPPPSKFTV